MEHTVWEAALKRTDPTATVSGLRMSVSIFPLRRMASLSYSVAAVLFDTHITTYPSWEWSGASVAILLVIDWILLDDI